MIRGAMARWSRWAAAAGIYACCAMVDARRSPWMRAGDAALEARRSTLGTMRVPIGALAGFDPHVCVLQSLFFAMASLAEPSPAFASYHHDLHSRSLSLRPSRCPRSFPYRSGENGFALCRSFLASGSLSCPGLTSSALSVYFGH
jgi:hypothetical protein